MTIDLDAAKAARLALRGEIPPVKFGGREFRLPPELPFDVYPAVAQMSDAQEKGEAVAIYRAVVDIMGCLLDDQVEDFLALKPSLPDLEELVSRVMRAYGVGVGESQGSESSSKSTSSRSKPTSKLATA